MLKLLWVMERWSDRDLVSIQDSMLRSVQSWNLNPISLALETITKVVESLSPTLLAWGRSKYWKYGGLILSLIILQGLKYLPALQELNWMWKAYTGTLLGHYALRKRKDTDAAFGRLWNTTSHVNPVPRWLQKPSENEITPGSQALGL